MGHSLFEGRCDIERAPPNQISSHTELLQHGTRGIATIAGNDTKSIVPPNRE